MPTSTPHIIPLSNAILLIALALRWVQGSGWMFRMPLLELPRLQRPDGVIPILSRSAESYRADNEGNRADATEVGCNLEHRTTACSVVMAGFRVCGRVYG